MAVPARLDIHVHAYNSRFTVIEAAGDIDMGSAPRLREQLLSALERSDVILEAADIAFCDSSGLRTLVEAQQAAHAQNAAFRLAAPSEAVLRVMELAGTLEAFGIFPDLETALKD
jgi:anti-anti-sigma factor